MSNKNLFKEAIADAKAVREAALANAKAALEEALTPKLQSMLAAKLNEMENYEEEGMSKPEMEEEGFDTNHFGWDDEDNVSGNKLSETDEEMDEDFDLSEILAELNEAEEELDPKDPKFTEKLKELIQDLIAQEMGNEGGEEIPMEPDADNVGGPSDHDADNAGDEIDLEELLAELDALGENDDNDKDDIMAERRKSKHEKGETKAQEKAEHTSGKEKEEMREAIRTINILRSELNEVNLLNAKLLYVNKIFKAKNLTESQKLKVIASFDKATTAKEAKVVFESLNANLTAAPKQAIKESFGFASKAAGMAPRKAIVETNDAITRMQKLANIIK